ncbi:hypothetical protein MHYP_G00051240 [Metynnis hypsauchen]
MLDPTDPTKAFKIFTLSTVSIIAANTGHISSLALFARQRKLRQRNDAKRHRVQPRSYFANSSFKLRPPPPPQISVHGNEKLKTTAAVKQLQEDLPPPPSRSTNASCPPSFSHST